MKFRGIEDALGKWVIIRLVGWPEELKSPVTGLGDIEGRWLQFKLLGIDSFGVWLENPYFKVSTSGDTKAEILQEQSEALKGKALVLAKWQYVATIIYLDGQKVDHIPLGFQATSRELQCQTD